MGGLVNYSNLNKLQSTTTLTKFHSKKEQAMVYNTYMSLFVYQVLKWSKQIVNEDKLGGYSLAGNGKIA